MEAMKPLRIPPGLEKEGYIHTVTESLNQQVQNQQHVSSFAWDTTNAATL
jgi:hypothetical protein